MDGADLAALLREHASRHSVPGAGIGLLLDGVVTTAYEGTTDVTRGEPVTAETRFSVGSLTKSMVATAIARLQQAGRLSFDDPVAAHVPELRGSEWAERGTVRDLMANRSRIPLRLDLEDGFDARRDEDDGALARLVADAAPGPPSPDVWSYSNLGWCVLGRLIETSADLTWEDAMRRHVFDPAGMRSTDFATGAPTRHRAKGHEVTAGRLEPVRPLVARAYGPAGTSVISTVEDLLRFGALHLEDESLAALRHEHAEPRIHAWLDAWCLGWARFDWQGGPVWGWDGLIRGERSVLRILPEHRAAVVLMTNSGTGRAMYRSLFAELMESQFGIAFPTLRLDPAPGAAGDLERFAGAYAWPDRRVEVVATGDGLRMTGDDGDHEAMPIDDRHFVVDADDPDVPTVTFGAFDPEGRANVLYEMLWGLPRLDA